MHGTLCLIVVCVFFMVHSPAAGVHPDLVGWSAEKPADKEGLELAAEIKKAMQKDPKYYELGSEFVLIKYITKPTEGQTWYKLKVRVGPEKYMHYNIFVTLLPKRQVNLGGFGGPIHNQKLEDPLLQNYA